MDSISQEQRSRIMAAIHSRDTKPELLVRRYLFACGFRYRLNSPRLPGHPDMVLRKYRTCIFVNGCFWHGHDCGAFRLPKTNSDFWQKKITRNRQRDVEVQQRLAAMGWHSITVWGCELTKKRCEQTLQSLELTLHRIYLQDHTFHYPLPEESQSIGMAAETHPENTHPVPPEGRECEDEPSITKSQ